VFRGAAALGLIFDEAIPLLEFLWNRETATRSPTVPLQRLALEQRFRALAEGIPDRTLARLFLNDFFRRLKVASGRGTDPVGARRASLTPMASVSVGPARLASGIAKPEGVAERELLWPIVAHPQLLAEIEEELAALELVEPELAALRDAVIGWYGEDGHLDPSGLRSHLCEIGFADLLGQLAARASSWCAHGRDAGSVLEGWRARVAQLQRFAERREVALAAEAAIAARRDGDATEQVLAIDRLINPRDARVRGKGVED
jgi:DNA primase